MLWQDGTDFAADPAQGPVDFWRGLDQARALLAHDRAATMRMLAACARRTGEDPAMAPGRRHVLERFCQTYGLRPPGEAQAMPMPPSTSLPRRIGTFAAGGEPGISLVTCCRNRNANLIRALPSWLAQPLVEIVIVDWTSDTPVADSLASAGITDPRIAVRRVEGEERWILSHAFNLGFRLARCATLLKADADIVLAPGFLDLNPLPEGQFVAGNWRTALPGQEFVNGFFLIARADLAAVNGFNEYVTTYGWDDDDLYHRLLAEGMTRRDVSPGSVRHLDHDDGERVDAPQATGDRPLRQAPIWLTRTNRLIAAAMPTWDHRRELSRFATRGGHGGPVLYRADPPAAVPEPVLSAARRLAAGEVLSWRMGPAVHELPAEAIDRLIDHAPADAVCPLHLDLARAGAPAAAITARRFLVCDLPSPPEAGDETVARLRHMAGERQIVLRIPAGAAMRIAEQSGLPVLPPGPPPAGAVEWSSGKDGGAQILWLRAEVKLPALSLRRERLFIDAQHGLGNRLRAIGSAAAVARATGRELVVVWTSDHHCEARLTDLIRWPGAVEEGARRGRNTCFLNYMEAEPGSAKDAPVVLLPGRDTWVRSAYVLNHPASTWAAENRELRVLIPSPEVAELVAPFPERVDIGLHIRAEGAAGSNLASYDQAGNWTEKGHAQIVHWRRQSGADRFIARLGILLAGEPAARCFLAADQAETYAAFAEAFDDRVLHLPRASFDRSVDQLRHAMADILLLSRARLLLRSNWSSFSEAAMRLSTRIERHETAGIDF